MSILIKKGDHKLQGGGEIHIYLPHPNWVMHDLNYILLSNLLYIQNVYDIVLYIVGLFLDLRTHIFKIYEIYFFLYSTRTLKVKFDFTDIFINSFFVDYALVNICFRYFKNSIILFHTRVLKV